MTQLSDRIFDLETLREVEDYLAQFQAQENQLEVKASPYKSTLRQGC